MAMVKKSISVTNTQDAWIKSQLTAGNYGNESEVVRELIRERQQREQEQGNDIIVQNLRAELLKAEQRGFTDKNVGQIWEEVRQRKE